MPATEEILDAPIMDEPQQVDTPAPQDPIVDTNKQKRDAIIIQLYKKGASKKEIEAVVNHFKTLPAQDPVQPKEEKKQYLSLSPTKQQDYLSVVGIPTMEETAEKNHAEAVDKAHKTIDNILGSGEKLQPIAEDLLKSKVKDNLKSGLYNNPMASDNARISHQNVENQIDNGGFLHVSPEDVYNFTQQIQQDPALQREALVHAKKLNPKIANDIDAALYVSDANERAVTPEKKIQISENEKLIKDKKVKYNPGNGQLIKPESLGESLHTASDRRNEDMALFDLADNGTDAQLLDKLNKITSEQDPDRPVPTPEGIGGGVGEFIGGQGKVMAEVLAAQALNVLPVVGTAAAESISGGLYAHEMARRGYANELTRSYASNKRAGLSDEESLEKAKEQAKRAMVVDAAVAGVMGKATSKAGSKFLNNVPLKEAVKLGTTDGWYNGVIKSGFEFLKKEAPVGLRNAALAGGGEITKNISANQLGQGRDVLEGAGGAAANMLALHYTLSAGMGLLGNGLKKTPTLYRKVLQGFTKTPIEDAKIIAAEQVQAGNLTPQDAARAIEDIEAHKEIDQQIPQSVKNDEVRLDLHKKVERRVELEEEAKTVNAAFKEPIKAKIEKLDGEIAEIVNSDAAKEESPKQEPEKPRVTVSTPNITNVKSKVTEFETESGSKYSVEGNSTTRNKSERVGAEKGDSGIKEPSEKTVYVSPEDLGKAQEIYLQGGDKKVQHEGNKVTITTEVNGRKRVTEFEVSNIPEVGKHPLEFFGDGAHLGNKIVNVKLKEGVEAPIRTPENVVEPEPKTSPVVTEGDLTGVTHAETDKVAQQMGLPTYEEKPETMAEWDAEAVKQIKEDPERVTKLLNKLKEQKQPTPVEQRIMAKYLASLKAKYEATKSEEVMSEYARAKKLSDEIGGREVAKSLVARKPLEPVEDSLPDYIYREMEENNAGLPLSEKQTEAVTKEFEDFQAKKDAFAKYTEKKEAELAEREAKLKIEKEAKTTKRAKNKTHEDFVKERKDILSNMRADLLKVAKGQGGLTASVPGVAQLAAIAPHVARMVKSLAEEGIIEFEKVLKNIHGQLSEVLPDIEEGQVRDMIAGKYNEKKGTRNETAAKIQDIKTEARLLGEIEDLMNEKVPTKESAAKRRNIKIEGLRKRIRSLRDEQGLTDPSKITAIKTRLQKELEKQQEKLKAGDFDPEPKKKPIELDEEGKKIKDALIKSRIDMEVAKIKRKYATETNPEKLKRMALEITNVPRTVMSSMDLSAPFRQGLVALVSHPVTGVKAMAKMLHAAKSQKVFDRWFFDLKESPEFNTMKESGLAITDPHDPKLAAKEEAFMNNLAQKIPFIGKAIKYGNEGKSIGGLISGSERAYVLFLNKMRADLFKTGMEAFESDGKNYSNSPELYKALAAHINNITGRGSLGKAEIVSPYLNTAFFSPRLMMSRISLLTNWANPSFYKNVPVEIRKMYFKDMAKFVAFGATMLGLAKLAGADVETDPRSTDALKIKAGNTRYDILGGFQQYIRFISQFVSGQKKAARDGKISELDGNGAFGEDRADISGRFLRGKLAPVPAMALDAIAGRDMMGNKIVYDQGLSLHSPYKKEKTWIEEYGGSLFPLIISDIKGAFQEAGAKSLLTVGVPAALGVGTQTFSDDTRPKRPTGSSSTKKNRKPSKPTRERSRK